jgi:hypothetical protein
VDRTTAVRAGAQAGTGDGIAVIDEGTHNTPEAVARIPGAAAAGARRLLQEDLAVLWRLVSLAGGRGDW